MPWHGELWRGREGGREEEREGRKEGGREGGREGWHIHHSTPPHHHHTHIHASYRLEYHPRSPALLPSLLAQGRATVEDALPQHIANSLNGLARLGGEGGGEERDAFIRACMVGCIWM
jgi:hypothetical protein